MYIKNYVLNVTEIEKALFCREKQCVCFLIIQILITRIVEEFFLCFITYSGYQFVADEIWSIEPNLKYIKKYRTSKLNNIKMYCFFFKVNAIFPL